MTFFFTMSTLETQYKNFLTENPTSTLTYDEWIEVRYSELSEMVSKLKTNISDNFEIGDD
jgi:hypothetical protein